MRTHRHDGYTCVYGEPIAANPQYIVLSSNVICRSVGHRALTPHMARMQADAPKSRGRRLWLYIACAWLLNAFAQQEKNTTSSSSKSSSIRSIYERIYVLVYYSSYHTHVYTPQTVWRLQRLSQHTSRNALACVCMVSFPRTPLETSICYKCRIYVVEIIWPALCVADGFMILLSSVNIVFNFKKIFSISDLSRSLRMECDEAIECIFLYAFLKCGLQHDAILRCRARRGKRTGIFRALLRRVVSYMHIYYILNICRLAKQFIVPEI